MIDERRFFLMKFKQAGYVVGNICFNEVIDECTLLCSYLFFLHFIIVCTHIQPGGGTSKT